MQTKKELLWTPAAVRAGRRNRDELMTGWRGFTLLELLIVIAVIAILSALAIPSYNNYMMRARRTDATRALTEAAAAMERYFSQNQTYQTATIGTGTPATDVYGNTSPDGFYTLALTAKTAATYTIQATPTGSQVRDTGCNAFRIDNTSARTVTGTLSSAECWRLK